MSAGTTEVYSWGNGANYQLGTGTAGIQRIPCRIDALQSLDVTTIAAGKFHSAAVTAKGAVYTWGFGRGGRLGHPDFDIHRSGRYQNFLFFSFTTEAWMPAFVLLLNI